MSNSDETVNLADQLGRQASLRPGAVAIYLPGAQISFRDLDVLVWRTATHLHRNGVRAGDVVALTFANELAVIITMLAAARIGATVFSIPASTPPLLRAEMAEQAGVRVLLTDVAGDETIGRARLDVDIEALAKASTPVDFSVREANPQAPWLLITGSGSTGRPKQFPVTHQVFRARMSLYSDRIEASPTDRVVSLIHSDYPSAKNQLLNAIFSGASICLFDRSRTHPADLCSRNNVTILYSVVVHLEFMLQSLPPGVSNVLGSLRALVPAGSLVSDDLRRRVVDVLTPNLFVRYGTTETGPISDATPGEVRSCPGTVGRPLSGVELEIVDESGSRRPPGCVGQIRIRSIGMVDRYSDDVASSEHAFRDGWFYPDDLGLLAPDGQLVFMGRADQMMIMDGINIYPAEIEAVLSRHPAVGDAAAVPVREPLHQEIPVCAVVLRKGAAATESELLEFAFQRLGARHPRRVVILDEIPRTGHGKLMIRRLNEQIVEKLRIPIKSGAA